MFQMTCFFALCKLFGTFFQHQKTIVFYLMEVNILSKMIATADFY